MTGRTWPEDVRAVIVARDNARCRRCGEPGGSVHHRRPRGMGGTRTTPDPSWGVVLCGTGTTGCHGWVESHRELARAEGYLLPAGMDPDDQPVWDTTTGQWVTLRADGMLEFTGDGTEPRHLAGVR